MDNVQIEIQDSDNSILGVLEVGNVKNFPLSLTTSISDLRDITKRSGSFSVAFKVPSTKANDELLEHIYLSDHKNWKDYDAEKDCLIRVNGMDIERGRLQITKINSIGRADAVTYSFKFFGSNMDWVLKMKGKKTADLPYLDKSITWNDTNVQASWSLAAGSDEPLYSWINRGQRVDPTTVKPDDLRPDYWLFDYLTSAFNSVGYNFDSTHFNLAAQKQLIIPYFGKNWVIPQATVDDNYVEEGITVGFNWNINQIIPNLSNANVFDIDVALIDRCDTVVNNNPSNTNIGYVCATSSTVGSYTEVADINNNFTAGIFTAPKTGYYKLSGYFDYEITYDHSQPEHISGAFRRSVGFFASHNAGYDWFNQTSSAITTTVNNPASTTKRESGSYETNLIYLQAGWGVNVSAQYRMDNVGSVTSSTTLARFKVHTETWFKIELQPEVNIGDTINWGERSDDQIDVFDIVMDVFKLFNCYIRTNNATKTVHVEPRDDFYNALSTATNKTDKINDNVQLQLEYNSKTYKDNHDFVYANDGNDAYLNARNKETHLPEWMSYEYAFPTKFKDGTTKYSTKVIAPTYTLEDNYMTSGALPNGYSLGGYTARLWNDANTLPLHSDDFAPRLLYFKYSTQVRYEWSYQGSTSVTIPYVLPFSKRVGYSTAEALVDGNLSFTDVYNPTSGNYAGLFQLYFSKTIQEIKDGKRLRISLLFDLADWIDFDFRDIIYFDNRFPEIEGYWRVEKISNFQPTGTQISTMFDLIQARTFPTVASVVIGEAGGETLRYGGRMSGGGLDTLDGKSGFKKTIIQGNNNYAKDSGNFVDGNNLRATGQDQTIMGIYNSDISSDISTDTFQLGTGTKEEPRTLIRVDEYGNTWFNGAVLPRENGVGLVVDITSDTTAVTTVDTYLVDTSSNDITVTLPAAPTIGKKFNTKKTSGTNTMTVTIEGQADSGATIDGSALITETTLNINRKFIYVGTNYNII